LATLGLSAADKEAVEAFRRDIVEPSMRELVILYFTAEWCGPCKTLGPIIDKVAAEYADKGVRLAKLDVDKAQFIAAQFQVRSVPTVYAMFQGQLVADLGQARTESALKATLDQILRQLPVEGEAQAAEAEIEPLVELGEAALAEGDAERALSIFDQLVELAPDHPGVAGGHARALVALSRADEAEAMLAELGEEASKAPEVARAKAALALAREASPVNDLAGLRARAAAAPDDLALRYELAGGLMAAGERDAAADELLASIAADREWNDGAARQRLLKLFEVVGLEDPWVSKQRRRLSAILFG
jgi:putative thioredoxin